MNRAIQNEAGNQTREADLSFIRVHYTNVHGLGAKQVVASLVPSLRKMVRISNHYMPADEKLGSEIGQHSGEHFSVFKRRIPKAASRMLECLLTGKRFEGVGPLLVLGDLPLRCRGQQFVLVHSPHLVASNTHTNLKEFVTFWVSRKILQINSKFVTAFFVQSDLVAEGLINTVGCSSNRVIVIPPPPPSWLSVDQQARTGRHLWPSDGLRLFYPAAEYPHKNHKIIWAAQNLPDWQRIVREVAVTIPKVTKGNHHASSVFFGSLTPEQILSMYSKADALIFPSKNETVGLPLLEAMVVGLPIVVSDRPYAKALCGPQAIYFDPDDPVGLIAALAELEARLRDGWWPNWSEQTQSLPKSWDAVAELMVASIKAYSPSD